jgi:hypothetical protein
VIGLSLDDIKVALADATLEVMAVRRELQRLTKENERLRDDCSKLADLVPEEQHNE